MLNVFDLLNIDGKDIETKLKDAINETKNELGNLDTNQTCMIYSGHLYNNLRKKHVMCRLVDTNDFGIQFKHQFVLVFDSIDSYFLADLTYEQFGEDEFLKQLISSGYEKMDSLKWAYYMSKFDIYGLPSLREVFEGDYLKENRVSK